MGWLERDVRVRVCGHVSADVALNEERKNTRERLSTYVCTYVRGKKGKTRKPVSCDVGGTFTRHGTKQNHVHVPFIRFYDRWRRDLAEGSTHVSDTRVAQDSASHSTSKMTSSSKLACDGQNSSSSGNSSSFWIPSSTDVRFRYKYKSYARVVAQP